MAGRAFRKTPEPPSTERRHSATAQRAPPITRPWPTIAIRSFTVAGPMTAVTLFAPSAVSRQSVAPEHAPVHLTRRSPAAGATVSRTGVPASQLVVHAAVQSIPGSSLVTSAEPPVI